MIHSKKSQNLGRKIEGKLTFDSFKQNRGERFLIHSVIWLLEDHYLTTIFWFLRKQLDNLYNCTQAENTIEELNSHPTLLVRVRLWK